MNTYLVTLFPPVGTAPPPISVQAAAFAIEESVIVFVDEQRESVMAVPLDLNPLVQRTATN